MKPSLAFYSTQSYDEIHFRKEAGNKLTIRFYPFELNSETAETAAGASVVCPFVNAHLDRLCLQKLQAVGVRHIALRSAGFNYVDLEAAKELALVVTRVPAYSPNAIAEHTAALLLCLNRNIHRAYNRTRDHNFALDGLVGFNLAGKTVGVVGCGKIGKKAAQIFRGFEMHVLAYDPLPDQEWAATHQVEFADLTKLFQNSHIISLHLPLLKETEYLIRAETLSQMKKGVILINTSRGKLINTEDLLAALRTGQVGAVGLDVYEEEGPYFFHDHSSEIINDKQLAYLLTFPNVLVTGHQAFLTEEALTEMASTTIQSILAFQNGQPLRPDTILIPPPM